ncbi:MAG: Holliday junction branch migration DNA helicase RuvB, partial [Candidatus Liptonbacteria bacterium]|nr:Holliday junction branch migration DNA helicase RuvB [Candidatus Liptonbacteria bacterium]
MKTGVSNSIKVAEDTTIDQALRPMDWADYVGQDRVKSNLRIIMDAAKKRGESVDH